MRFVSSSVEWDSVPTENVHMPKEWGEFEGGDDLLRLKDTRGKYWKNTLVSPNTFRYTFPRRSRREWEERLSHRICRRVQTGTPLKVHLFATPAARNEYYGEWVVSQLEMGEGSDKCVLTLKRLEEQADMGRYTHVFDARRSKNEVLHHTLLSTLFFPEEEGWIVTHEPETLMDLHQPSVKRGVPQDVVKTSRSYTCDFVASRKCERICIESKPCVEHVTPEALAKCRMLRDRTLSRVLFMCGHRHDLKWMDMGEPGGGSEAWYDSFEEWKEAMIGSTPPPLKRRREGGEE